MRPLMMDDLLPLDEYAGRRHEFFESLIRYVDRYRRVRIGPRVTLLFENRQTLWFRVQEVLRVARLADPVRVQQELDIYNRLLPKRDRLQAALLLDVTADQRLSEELASWQTLRGEDLRFHVGEKQLAANLFTCRPEDHAIGAAHWVQFHIDAASRKLLADTQQLAQFDIRIPSYQYESPPLGEEIRQSLLDDLNLSDRDGEEVRTAAVRG